MSGVVFWRHLGGIQEASGPMGHFRSTMCQNHYVFPVKVTCPTISRRRDDSRRHEVLRLRIKIDRRTGPRIPLAPTRSLTRPSEPHSDKYVWGNLKNIPASSPQWAQNIDRKIQMFQTIVSSRSPVGADRSISKSSMDA